MEPATPVPPRLSQEAKAVLDQVTESITAGDLDGLTTAIQDFIGLSATDKKTIEDVASTLPNPALPQQLITEIFANPELTIGIAERLGKTGDKTDLKPTSSELGTAEQAIVLDALISWLKSGQKLTLATTGSSGAVPGVSLTSSAHTNPLNLALQNYLATQASQPINMSSLQFLKNNAITLAGLKIADPALLSQAYDKASQELLINLLPDINTSNITSQNSEQSRSNVIHDQLVNDIKKALQDSAIPLNMQTFLVLWTAITMPETQKTLTSVTAQTKISEVNQKASIPIPPPVTVSITSSFSALADKIGFQLPSTFVDSLGMLSAVYTQMAPYWSGPAAVSIMTQTGGELTDSSKTQSAVRAFAITLGTLLNDPSFDKLLAALIAKNAPNISLEQLKTFISAMKISILMNALVALRIVLLRKFQGQFTADELARMIVHNPLEESDVDDLEKGLIKSIQTELANLPENAREDFINNLLSAYSPDTDVNALIDPTKQFLNLIDPTLNIDSASQTKG